MKSFFLGISALLGGFILGGLGTSFILHITPAALITSVKSLDEDDVGPTSVEHLRFERMGVAASTTAVAHMQTGEGMKNGATATSSPRSVRVPVVIYHSVRPYIPGESKSQDVYDVTPELFEQELAYTKEHGFTTVTFADIGAYFDGGVALPPKPVILSLDDGWRNQYLYAFPLLKKFGMKGTFFIFTNPINHKKNHWMSWDEVREIDRAGMEIGGHSRTHPVLTTLKTDAALDSEVAGGKSIIEKELGHPIAVFAYPFGAKNSRVVEEVSRAGYVLARTTIGGVWDDPEHRFLLHGTLSTDKLTDFEKLLNKE